jgi:hypothetical protein
MEFFLGSCKCFAPKHKFSTYGYDHVCVLTPICNKDQKDKVSYSVYGLFKNAVSNDGRMISKWRFKGCKRELSWIKSRDLGNWKILQSEELVTLVRLWDPPEYKLEVLLLEIMCSVVIRFQQMSRLDTWWSWDINSDCNSVYWISSTSNFSWEFSMLWLSLYFHEDFRL